MLIIRPRRASWTSAALLVLASVLLLPAAPARAQTQRLPDEVMAQARDMKAAQRRILMAGPLRHLQHNREYAKAVQKALRKHQPVPPRGAALKKPLDDVEPAPFPGVLPRYSIEQALATIPTNVRCNNPAGDVAGAGQAEESIASCGHYALVAWNDGQGFWSGADTQGYGWSNDGGLTFTDGGMAAAPDRCPPCTWTSDPVVTVNEKTGEFWYCGLYDQDATHNGIGVVKATFTAGGITWDTVRIPDMQLNSSFFIDKEWCVVDSLTGNLYVTYTKFTVADDSIMFTRSTDGGVTWSAPKALSNPATAGYQQGSRPVVGPNGEVYVVWSELGPIDADFFYVRKSTDFGVTFSPEVQAVSHFANYGTGAPGFNRERSVDFPSIAVDRTSGPHRGRVYLTWHESVNWYNDPLGGGGSKTEVETNNAFTSATPFTIGQKVRGTFSSSTDQDWYSFSATQGTTYIFGVDSIPRPLYTMRVYCTDGTTRLTFTGVTAAPAGFSSYSVFTAPTTGTYYLRMTYVSGGLTGGYRIVTGTNTPTAELGRDQRDVVANYSDNGTTWSTPVRVNDEPAWFDDWLPEVAVGGDGLPYVMWYDWRDATVNCGGSSHVYVARSNDDGNTWVASQRVTSAATPWSSVASNIAPNQGDYNAMYADVRYVRPSWADGRLGTPDVYTAAIDTWFSVADCPRDTSLSPLDVYSGNLTLNNLNPLFANDYTFQWSASRGWPLSTPGTNVAAVSSASVPWSLAVPDTAAPGPVSVTLSVLNSAGTLVSRCPFTVTVLGSAGVGPEPLAFRLGQNVPNPIRGGGTRIGFSLPQTGHVKLEVFDLGGQRVRTLVDGQRAAGPNFVIWDGRDERGHAVHAGTYFYRLSGLGQSAVKRMVVLP